MLRRWALGASLALSSAAAGAAGPGLDCAEAATAGAQPICAASRPHRFPHLPRLTEDRAPDVCRALEAASRESFKSASPRVSAMDRAWPGVEVEWLISPATVSGREGHFALAHSADLDGDGQPEMLVLLSRYHSWRGDVYSLARFPSPADFAAFETRAEESSPGKGESLLVYTSGSSGPFPWDWRLPTVLTVNGRHYFLEEGPSDATPARLYRIPATGDPERVCVVETLPYETADWAAKAGMAALLARLSAIVGGSGWCGSLDPPGRLALAAERMTARALLRPWVAGDIPYNSRRGLDAWLAKWATEGVWNWDAYTRFNAEEPKALHSLAAWYEDAFGIADAGREAGRVLDLLIRSHFVFPREPAEPEPSPLGAALLRGAPAAEVAPLLNGADLGQPPSYMEENVSEDAPLVLALDHPPLVRLLLEAGAPANSANSFGKTPLMYAAQRDSAEAVRLLLAAGAEVNARSRSVDSCTLQVHRGDRTPLHYAAGNAGLAVIRLLVEAGADIRARDKHRYDEPSQTPLDYLARNAGLSADDRREAERLLRPGR